MTPDPKFSGMQDGPEVLFSGGVRVPLEAVIITAELERRPSRAPDYEAENRCLASLMAEMVNAPSKVLQKLVETALNLCRAHSAGVSILEEENGAPIFRWHAVAGPWSVHRGGTMSREASPCGTVVERNSTLLMSFPERHFNYEAEITLPIAETLLIPFLVADEPVGTIWVIAHDESRKFDREDRRILENLGNFAAAIHRNQLVMVELAKSYNRLQAEGAECAGAEETRYFGSHEMANPAGEFQPTEEPRPTERNLLEDALEAKRRVEQVTRALRESEAQLEMELAGAKLLQDISLEMLREDNLESLYEKIMDAAVAIMRSDFASMQLLCPERGSGGALRLLTFRGFNPQAAEFWKWVHADSQSACGAALDTGKRVIVRDVNECGFMAGTEDLMTYVHTGIRAVQSTPLVSRSGKVVGMISTHWRKPYDPAEGDLRLFDILMRQAADLLERKQAEEALRQRTAQFETLLNNAPIGVYLVDSDFRIRQVNPTALPVFGDIPDLIGRDFDDVIHVLWTKKYADEVARVFRRTLQTGESYETREKVEYRIDRQVNEYYAWRVDRIPLPEGGHGVVCYFRDISQQVKARQALKELDQRKDEFLANMSHEIRSPLTGIMGYADLLLTRLKDPFDIQCLNTIKESGNYLIEIVNDILDLSKIEAGKLVLKMESMSPHSVLRDIHALMDVRAREKNLPLALRYEGVPPAYILTDRTRLRQIVINLVSNAIKFTERGQVEIVVRFLREEEQLQIEVIDTGIGIAPEHQAILFQPFTQADSTSTRRYGGTGLGLTITKRLVEMLGGRIEFESELGRGSTFRVTIPTGAAEESRPTNTFAPAPDELPNVRS